MLRFADIRCGLGRRRLCYSSAFTRLRGSISNTRVTFPLFERIRATQRPMHTRTRRGRGVGIIIVCGRISAVVEHLMEVVDVLVEKRMKVRFFCWCFARYRGVPRSSRGVDYTG